MLSSDDLVISTCQLFGRSYLVCVLKVCMANKKANKKVSAKASKQQPRSEAPKRKVRTKVTPCLCVRIIGGSNSRC